MKKFIILSVLCLLSLSLQATEHPTSQFVDILEDLPIGLYYRFDKGYEKDYVKAPICIIYFINVKEEYEELSKLTRKKEKYHPSVRIWIYHKFTAKEKNRYSDELEKLHNSAVAHAIPKFFLETSKYTVTYESSSFEHTKQMEKVLKEKFREKYK